MVISELIEEFHDFQIKIEFSNFRVLVSKSFFLSLNKFRLRAFKNVSNRICEEEKTMKREKMLRNECVSQ